MHTSGISHAARRLVGEALRFLAVGGAATLVSVVGFNALVHGILLETAPMRHHPVAAYVLVNLVAGVAAYLGLRLWAFSHRDVTDAVTGLTRFFALGAATMTIPVVCLVVSRHLLGLSGVWADNVSANVIGLALGTAARFWVFRRYVFLAQPRIATTGASSA